MEEKAEQIASDKFTPRLLGATFILVAVASAFSGFLLLSLIEPDNISATMISISDNPTKMQMSIVGELITSIGIVLLAVLLYTTLKTQNEIIARWALGLWIIEAASLAISRISAFSLLNVSQEFVKAGAPDPSYFQTLGSLYYESAQFGYEIHAVFWTLGGILFYYLFLRSRYIPKIIPICGIILTSAGFIGELFVLFGYYVPIYVFLPSLPYELAIGTWLMVKGIKDGSEI
ncbi:DUF4386 domain-containing protein [Methanococcoides methylutens]|uniref:DUF4386 domain-containing protein n=1 Tax=Methanococcoides methylutens TaxID=2226 RepID=UPI004043D848